MDSIPDVDEDDPVSQPSVSDTNVNTDKRNDGNTGAGTSLPLPSPTSVIPVPWSTLLPRFPHLVEPGSTAFISPSKEAEVQMEMSPYEKKQDVNCQHLSGSSENRQANTARQRPKIVSALFTKNSNSEETEASEETTKDELQPKQLFVTSPSSPSDEFKAMLDDINVPESPEDNEEDFLKRQPKSNLRRCRSLELRKHLHEIVNTPPGGFRKGAFKRPPEVGTRQLRYAKRAKGNIEDVPEEASSTSATLTEEESDAHYDEAKDFSKENEQHEPVISAVDENEDHKRIKTAVDAALESPDLIADGSRVYCLPVITGKHSDLKNISPHTMADLLRNKFQEMYDKLTVIDCRYPYEYNGGHIRNAINIYTEKAMVEFLNKEVQVVTETARKHILIFHCEFSSQRGPSLLRHLRKCDRQMNLQQYPQLTFPEVYCLDGGYKEFFQYHPELCDPSNYVPMIDEKYSDDLKHFRAKAKSWAAGEKYRHKKF